MISLCVFSVLFFDLGHIAIYISNTLDNDPRLIWLDIILEKSLATIKYQATFGHISTFIFAQFYFNHMTKNLF